MSLVAAEKRERLLQNGILSFLFRLHRWKTRFGI